MNYSTANINKKQQSGTKQHLTLDLLVEFRPLPIVLKNNGEFLLTARRSALSSLDCLISIDNGHTHIFPTQTTIGEKIDYSRETVCRDTTWLASLRIIRKSYNHMHSCDYTLSPIFYDPYWRKVFSGVLPALLFTLFPSTIKTSVKRHLDSNVTRIYKSSLKEKDILYSTSNDIKESPPFDYFKFKDTTTSVTQPPPLANNIQSTPETIWQRGVPCGEGGKLCRWCVVEKK